MPAIVALFYAAMRWFLIANVVGFMVRVLVAFGINIVLIQPAVDTIVGVLQGQFGLLPPVAYQWVVFFNLPRYVGLILSGYAIQQTANFVLRINR